MVTEVQSIKSVLFYDGKIWGNEQFFILVTSPQKLPFVRSHLRVQTGKVIRRDDLELSFLLHKTSVGVTFLTPSTMNTCHDSEHLLPTPIHLLTLAASPCPKESLSSHVPG